jgi:vancomycin resistance protein YoaR
VRVKTRARILVVGGLVLVLLAGGGYAAAYVAAGDKLPRGATISGVDVGGLTPADAEQALRDGLGDTVAQPIEVAVEGADGDVVELDPADAGLAVDYAASVRAAAREQSWHPGDVLDYFTGGDDARAVVDVDEAALDAAIVELESGLGTEPVDGTVSLTGGEVTTTEPETGRGLEPDSTREALVDSYLSGERAELAITELQPDIDQADVDEAVTSFAEPALAAPVVLKIGSARVRLEPADYADALTLAPVDGELEPSIDAEAIAPLVDEATAGKGEPVDARIELRDGKPRVVKAKPGVTFEPDDVAEAFLGVVTAPEGSREATVDGTVQQPDFTTQDARALGVRRQVSTFTTNFPYAEYRNINIGRAAEIIDGTLLKPGEVFSMNETVGERTRENGFTEGFIISNGIFKEDLGGGVSQMATTLFNGMFFAGLEDIEHKPHSFYIDRYPVGREATVAWPTVDLRFRNDTDHGVLIDTELDPSTPSSQGAITVTMYSTKVWDIESVTSDRYAYTSAATRTLDTPDCYPNSGYSGFTVDVTRIFKRPGSDEVEKREKFNTVYTPSDTVICRPPGSLSGGGGGD